MEKTTWETILAVIIGIIVGIIVATGFWFIKDNKININTQKPKNAVETQSTAQNQMVNNPLILEIQNKEQTVLNTSIYELKIKTNVSVNLIITHNNDDYADVSGQDGTYTRKLELVEGINIITVTVFDGNKYLQEKLKLVYDAK